MPHSTRTKRQNPLTQKRLQVTDDDGWTHVTTGGNARRTMRGTKGPKKGTSSSDRTGATTAAQDIESGPVLSPAEAPGRLTLEALQAQYATHRDTWTGSETWNKLEKFLDERVQSAQDEFSGLGAVDRIVCIGLGSPSGFLRDGWVDRRSVSMYQLAALERIKKRLGSSVPVYAQDPVFNKLDCALLDYMGITVVEHPVGFENVTRNTLLFCPGAERKHLELVLPSNPGFVFGGPLENTESEIIQTFVGKMSSRALEPFASNEHAFWMTRFYFREEEENDEVES
ncbi:uncharacterized protein N7484_003644 [Penicillium longicatenatum]|uniref:uncharacterized protein n=1 Tax=Penicillium longicatenatum TaxID=1561947 RepID=UPI0025475890|nr:uncharacterized protein N7484_003644 [Penicillium longicatenatum]KAJ5649921.1 hypothetical protein N7484_003644 [Penicillium longicatenatum]